MGCMSVPMADMALSDVIEQIFQFDFFYRFWPTFSACISQDRGCISVPIGNMAFSDVILIKQIWAI